MRQQITSCANESSAIDDCAGTVFAVNLENAAPTPTRTGHAGVALKVDSRQLTTGAFVMCPIRDV